VGEGWSRVKERYSDRPAPTENWHMSNNKGDTWKELNWGDKVSICEKARASENYLLHVYILTVMAIQAVLFALLVKFWGQPAAGFLALPGIGVAVYWAFVAESRGNKVDIWEEELYKMWEETSQPGSFSSEIVEHYKGAADRRDKRKRDNLATFKGWGRWHRFTSARWIFVTVAPSFLILLWIVLAVFSVL